MYCSGPHDVDDRERDARGGLRRDRARLVRGDGGVPPGAPCLSLVVFDTTRAPESTALHVRGIEGEVRGLGDVAFVPGAPGARSLRRAGGALSAALSALGSLGSRERTRAILLKVTIKGVYSRRLSNLRLHRAAWWSTASSGAAPARPASGSAGSCKIRPGAEAGCTGARGPRGSRSMQPWFRPEAEAGAAPAGAAARRAACKLSTPPRPAAGGAASGQASPGEAATRTVAWAHAATPTVARPHTETPTVASCRAAHHPKHRSQPW